MGKKKNPLDNVSLLRRKQHYCLNKVPSFPSKHKILCQEAQLLYVYWRSFSLVLLYTTSSSFPPPLSIGFEQTSPDFVNLHSSTPRLFNLLLKQVSTTVQTQYIKFLRSFPLLKSQELLNFSKFHFNSFFSSLKYFPAWISALEVSYSIAILTLADYVCTQNSLLAWFCSWS